MRKMMKALLPEPVLNKLRVARARRDNGEFNSLSTQQVFSTIYEQGLWGKSENPADPFCSGTGSHDDSITGAYVARVTEFLGSQPTKPDVVDLGCGDFAVGSRIRPFCGNYVACDIVPQLIARNKAKFSALDVDFRVLNLVSDPLPAGDVVCIRQVLQHLSNDDIRQVVPKLQATYSTLILTEHIPKSTTFTPNLDKPTGPGIRIGYHSGIVLTRPPFNLRAVDERVLCEVDESGGVIRTTLYRLR